MLLVLASVKKQGSVHCSVGVATFSDAVMDTYTHIIYIKTESKVNSLSKAEQRGAATVTRGRNS